MAMRYEFESKCNILLKSKDCIVGGHCRTDAATTDLDDRATTY